MSLFYRTLGPKKGPPVLLLHGIACTNRAWANVPQILAKAGMRVILVDLPGHGDSELPIKAAEDLVRFSARSLKEMMQEHGPAVVVGHSYGAAVAGRLAETSPELVKGLVLCAPGGFHRLQVGIPTWIVNRYTQRALTGAVRVGAKTVLSVEPLEGIVMRYFTGTGSTHLEDGTTKEILRDVARSKGVPLAGLALAREVLDPQKIQAPVWAIWGTQDRVTFPWLLKRQLERLPNLVRVQVLTGVGHLLPQEAPQEVADLILEAVKSTSTK